MVGWLVGWSASPPFESTGWVTGKVIISSIYLTQKGSYHPFFPVCSDSKHNPRFEGGLGFWINDGMSVSGYWIGQRQLVTGREENEDRGPSNVRLEYLMLIPCLKGRFYPLPLFRSLNFHCLFVFVFLFLVPPSFFLSSSPFSTRTYLLHPAYTRIEL